jgi:hypothetical protein
MNVADGKRDEYTFFACSNSNLTSSIRNMQENLVEVRSHCNQLITLKKMTKNIEISSWQMSTRLFISSYAVIENVLNTQSHYFNIFKLIAQNRD